MNIYVGNLSFDTTEDQLRQAFSGFGEVTTINIITDKYTGEPRGFAFVEMSGKAEAIAAISGLNGQDLNGRTLNVNEARPRTEGGGGGRGGGGGNRGGSGGGGGRGGYRDRRY
jgi:RNA recognition motif-containing protein